MSALELVVVADHPVDVVAEVEVRVEDVGVLRGAPAQLLVPPRDELLRPFERFVHRTSV